MPIKASLKSSLVRLPFLLQSSLCSLHLLLIEVTANTQTSLSPREYLKKGSFGSADSTHSTSHPPEDLNDSDYEAYKKSMNELKEEYGINYAQMKKLKVIPGSGKIREIRKRLEEKIGKAAKKWGWGREEAIEALEDADWDFEEMELQLNAGSLLPRSEI